MNAGDGALACCRALVDVFVRGGMRHACVSPGSRSTAIALALERDPRVTVHVHLDERSSAFFALGIAKATGAPVAVACTSGTAAAEFLPAVVEAKQSGVPLILLTADRPAHLRGTGANQTIDQMDLFGWFARTVEDLSPPDEDGRTRWAWELAAQVALERAGEPSPGPVHLNLQFEEPLVPSEPPAESGTVIEPRHTELQAPPLIAADDVDRLASELSGTRAIVLLGSMRVAPMTTLVLADRMGWPVIAEPASGGRVPGFALTAGQALLASERWTGSHPFEVVVQVGAAPTTRASQRAVATAGRLIVVDAHHPEPDTEGRADLRMRTSPDVLAAALLELPLEPAPEDHRASWSDADRLARMAIDERYDSWIEPYEGRVARDVSARIPDGGTLVVGSSMPIRDLDYSMAPREQLRVIANRGASGIDGFVSTALGVAASGTGPTFALMGDLTFLHDVGGFLWNARRGTDAVLVVVDNGGGTIFSFLGQRDLPELDRLFTTPHGLDLGAVAASAGSGYARVERADELVASIDRAASGGGVQVVHVIVDAELNRTRHAEVQSAVDEALS